MLSAPPAPNEPRRLQTLRTMQILDTPPEAAFDAITEVLSESLDFPIALLTLVDQDRQWFKSRRGLTAAQTPRAQAFCAHAILGAEQFLVRDALKDLRFLDNPLVLGEPLVRFYAGQPLSVDGQAVGTLCVIDHAPRAWPREHADMLARMAVIAQGLLQARFDACTHAIADARRREQADFLSRVSHELRTPLSAVLSFHQLLREDLDAKLQPHHRRWMDLAQQGGRHMIALTDDLLALGEQEKRDLRPQGVALDGVVRDCIGFIEPLARRARVSLRFECAGGDAWGRADLTSLWQVLLNVLGNAIKYSPADSTVRVTLDKQQADLELTVTDAGPGIPADRLHRLFVPFDRLGAEFGAIPGTGLGLAIAKTLLEAMQGHIEVTSPALGGCCVRILLPRVPACIAA